MQSRGYTLKAKSVFESRPLDVEAGRQIEAIKDVAAELWDLLEAITPECASRDIEGDVWRHRALAKTALEECVMWASKAISRSQS